MYSKCPLAIQEPFSRIVRPYNDAGSCNATVFISMLSGGELAFPTHILLTFFILFVLTYHVA